MTPRAEVRTRQGWRLLLPDHSAPRILETDDIECRGFAPHESVRLGPTFVNADAAGEFRIRPSLDEGLQGHVGFVEVRVNGALHGEIELVPGKLAKDRYLQLRADLQRVWTDLVLDPGGATTVRAQPPSACELWARIEAPIQRIVDRPNEQLAIAMTVQRLDRVKRVRELRPGVVRAGMQGRAAVTRSIQRSQDTPENHLAATTLQLLRNHARRDAGATDLVQRIDGLLREPLFGRANDPVRSITWGMRSDSRYRQILGVHRILNRPELAATEGPGELRLGVPALSRLYEYWVFLQVLLAAQARYGPPVPPGFDVLAIAQRGGRRRLELRAGTTVTFPGPVHVAFEPRINTRGDGWMGLEYVPHPDPDRQQLIATPDVVVFRADQTPWITIIDAKYVGRLFVEAAAARLHEKYSRMRWHGMPVVRNVLAAHPHEGLSRQWAGYGHVQMAPGAIDTLPLPLPNQMAKEVQPTAGSSVPEA